MSDAVLSNFTPTVHEERSFARKLKVAIIGTGWIAEAHIESYKNMPDVEVVAMADLVPGKAEAFAKRYGVEGVRLYPNHTALLAAEKDLDAVSVCTYNRTHAECAIDALRAGVNVLLEKPMCVTIEEAAQIVRAEKASGKLLSIGFQPRM
ncbi:MAG: Gfo/Idh/MocA family oxidoreductase, partial [Clostridia bacterium]